MPTYKLRGINVEFPYEAYELQIQYMERVICALQEESHALLESPTGTGKTLCLLCATIAWRQHQYASQPAMTNSESGSENSCEKSAVPPIVYSSRTHSQLSQAMKEIKKTNYSVKATVLGSRQQQCCNPLLKDEQGSVQNQHCQKLVKAHQCSWHDRMDDYEGKKARNIHAARVLDIEDLNKFAKKNGPCPYFFSRKMAEICDILFVPYNYLLDRRARKSLETFIYWQKAVAIIDEAHNIEQCCSEAASFDMNLTVLNTAIFELEKAKKLAIRSPGDNSSSSGMPKTARDSFLLQCPTLIKMIETLEGDLEKMELPSSGGKAFPGEYIFSLFSNACITDSNWKVLMEVLKQASELLADDPKSNDTSSDQSVLPTQLNGVSCEFLADVFEKVFETKQEDLHKAFRVFILREKSKLGLKTMTLSYWCFSPGIAMKNFVTSLHISSVILTSGTLSPLASFAAELQLQFPVQLENKHIISKKQVLVGCVLAGPTGCRLDSSFNCRNDPKYKEDLGLAIIDFVKTIPGGVLTFFPSYAVLQSCLEYWKVCKREGITLWQTITQIKGVAVEPKNPNLFLTAMKEYKQKIDKNPSKGCILFAVCRGKVSEGIDFSDDAARAVIIAGIPFAPIADPKVKLKREYLNTQKGGLNGSQWYTQMATRAVNQALGRVIRHKDDYGVILLCDRRLGDSGTKNQLSKWIKNYFTNFTSFQHTMKCLKEFFKDAGSTKTSDALQNQKDKARKQETVKSTSASGGWKRSSLICEPSDAYELKKQKREESGSVAIDLTKDSDTESIISVREGPKRANMIQSKLDAHVVHKEAATDTTNAQTIDKSK